MKMMTLILLFLSVKKLFNCLDFSHLLGKTLTKKKKPQSKFWLKLILSGHIKDFVEDCPMSEGYLNLCKGT